MFVIPEKSGIQDLHFAYSWQPSLDSRLRGKDEEDLAVMLFNPKHSFYF